MKMLAYLANGIFLVILTVEAAGQYPWNGSDLLIMTTLYGYCLINCAAISRASLGTPIAVFHGASELIRLHSQRMKLEQEKRISQLKKELGKE